MSSGQTRKTSPLRHAAGAKPLFAALCLVLGGAATAAPPLDYASLLKSLRAETSVKREGKVAQPFFSVKGKVIGLYGDHVQIFEYRNAAMAEREAALVSPDGQTIGTAKPHWLGPPHFFRKDRLIVLYLGTDEKILKALEARLGQQFAGD